MILEILIVSSFRRHACRDRACSGNAPSLRSAMRRRTADGGMTLRAYIGVRPRKRRAETMTDTTDQEDLSSIWGVHTVPALAGVRGNIEFVGPGGSAHMEIADGLVTLSPQNGKADVVIRSEESGELLRLVRGELNVVIAVLQGCVEASGDLLLALKVAGSLPELGRKQTSAAPAQAGA
jgi:hypothetical protein